MVNAVFLDHRSWWQVWSGNGFSRLGVFSIQRLGADLFKLPRCNHSISNLKVHTFATHDTETIAPTTGISVRT